MPSSTRRLLLLALPTVALPLAVAVWLFWPHAPSAITRENAAKIQPGVTLPDVDVLLGGPSRDEATGPILLDGPQLSAHDPGPDEVEAMWITEGLMISVWSDRGGLVTHSEVFNVRRQTAGPLHRIRRLLGL